jgi:hypothetical protein
MLSWLTVFLFSPFWQAWPGAALMALFYWLALHMYRYPDGAPATTTNALALGVAVLAVNGITRGYRRNRLADHRRRLGNL